MWIALLEPLVASRRALVNDIFLALENALWTGEEEAGRQKMNIINCLVQDIQTVLQEKVLPKNDAALCATWLETLHVNGGGGPTVPGGTRDGDKPAKRHGPGRRDGAV